MDYRHLHKIIGHSVAAMLLVIYACSSFFQSNPSLHSAHDHAIEDLGYCAHDPCHLSIYHPGDPDGCNHKFHFTRGHEDCIDCHKLFLPQENTDSGFSFYLTLPKHKIVPALTCHLTSSPVCQTHNKGPPQLV